MISSCKEKYKKFREWQQTPFQVAPLSEEEHTCATCSTEYKGNFCPRCGQSAKVQPRMSIGKTFLLILDVWGLGNRGMFRTVRDLLLRPGYLICDYLQGRRGAYFPPFKLLFLLTTLSLVVGHGLNVLHENYQLTHDAFNLSVDDVNTGRNASIIEGLTVWINSFLGFQRDYPAIFQLIAVCVGGYFFYIFFQKSKILVKITFSEFFVALIYMVDMYVIVITFIRFFGYFGIDKSFWLWVPLLYFIPLKQMSGYSLWGTIWRASCGLFLGIIALLILMLSVITLAVLVFQSD